LQWLRNFQKFLSVKCAISSSLANIYFVYILKSDRDKSLYIGYTNDLKRRFVEHNTGKSRFTKHKTPYQFVYYESYASMSDAKHRESQLKKHAGAKTHLLKSIHNSLEQVRGD